MGRIRWKVYNKTLPFSLVAILKWDGVFVEAESEDEAIEIRKQQLEDLDGRCNNGYIKYRHLFAIPEGWELPLNINYTQKDLFE